MQRALLLVAGEVSDSDKRISAYKVSDVGMRRVAAHRGKISGQRSLCRHVEDSMCVVDGAVKEAD